MSTNTYNKPVLFVLGSLFVGMALLFYCSGLDGLKSKIGQPIKTGLSYLGNHWIDVVIWRFIASRLFILLVMAWNHEEITWAGALTYQLSFSSLSGWWIILAVIEIAIPILSCNLLRSGPWGKWLKKVHIV